MAAILDMPLADVNKKVRVQGWQDVVDVGDGELFENYLQAVGATSLKNTGSGLIYRGPVDSVDVLFILAPMKVGRFLDEHGEEYEIEE